MPHVRDATTADAPRVAEVHVASWEQGYRGMLPDEYLDRLDPADRVEFWRSRIGDPPPRSVVLVGEDDEGTIRGLCTIVPHEDLGRTWAVLPHLYLEPSAWGQGLGPLLMDVALERARALGYEHIELWVVPDNVRARHVYEREGWTTDGTEKVEEVWGAALPEVRYTRPL